MSHNGALNILVHTTLCEQNNKKSWRSMQRLDRNVATTYIKTERKKHEADILHPQDITCSLWHFQGYSSQFYDANWLVNHQWPQKNELQVLFWEIMTQSPCRIILLPCSSPAWWPCKQLFRRVLPVKSRNNIFPSLRVK